MNLKSNLKALSKDALSKIKGGLHPPADKDEWQDPYSSDGAPGTPGNIQTGPTLPGESGGTDTFNPNLNSSPNSPVLITFPTP